MLDIYEYSDYRKYLREYYAQEKARDAKFSLRYFTQKVGLKSSGFFSDILAGKKNLTGPYTLKFAKLLKLDTEAEEYFINLVHFNQAKTLEEKNRYYEKMMVCGKVKVDLLEPHQYDYFSKWHHAVIRELLHFYPFRTDFVALAKQLDPPIKPTDAKASIELLTRLELIAPDAKGFFRPTTKNISVTPRFSSLHSANWHHGILALAERALDHFPSTSRGFSSLTLPLTADKVKKAKRAVKNLRMYLMALSENGEQADRVVQFNFQIFPISQHNVDDGHTF